MSIVDPVGDMFTRIRNGQMRNLNSVNIPASKFRSKILEILQSEGYINSFFLENNVNSILMNPGDSISYPYKEIEKHNFDIHPYDQYLEYVEMMREKKSFIHFFSNARNSGFRKKYE